MFTNHSHLFWRAKFAPPGQSGGAVQLKIDPAVEMSLVIEIA